MNEQQILEMMVEEIVYTAHAVVDILGSNPSIDIADASHSAIKQLLAIKAYALVTQTKTLTIPLQDFVKSCR